MAAVAAAARDHGGGRLPDTLSIIVSFVGNEMSQLPRSLSQSQLSGVEAVVEEREAPSDRIWEIGICATYRDWLKGVQILLSNSQAGPGRTVKQEHEEISRNHVQAFFRTLFTFGVP